MPFTRVTFNPYPDLNEINEAIRLYKDIKPKGRYKNRKLKMNLCQASDNYPVLPRVCKSFLTCMSYS